MRQLSHVLALGLMVATLSAAPAADLSIDITVSPKVMVLSAPTKYVHIHSNILMKLVDRPSLGVTVDGETLDWTSFGVFADSRGLMVIKIDQDLVDPLVAPGSATFVVAGSTTGGESFEGADTIRVKE